MMRTPLRLVAASAAAAALVAGAAGATAEPLAPVPAPAPVADGTGSSALDAGSAGAQTGSYYLERGDLIGMFALLVNLPFAILLGDVCELTTNSAIPSPCIGTDY